MELDHEQAEYIGVDVEGPYKPGALPLLSCQPPERKSFEIADTPVHPTGCLWFTGAVRRRVRPGRNRRW